MIKIKSILNSFIKLVVSEDAYLFLLSKYLLFMNRKKDDLYRLPYFVRFKKNAPEKYCIFRFMRPYMGLFATANMYVFAYDWAVKKGYIPIIDWEYLYSFKKLQVGDDNAWDYVFEQKNTVKEVLNKDWVYVKEIGMENAFREETSLYINNDKKDYRLHIVSEDWRNYYKRINEFTSKCWVFREDFLIEVNEYINKFMTDRKWIGISLQEDFSVEADKLRENKYAKEIYSIHPKTTGISDIIKQVKNMMLEWGCDNLFVATVYQESIELFSKEFGEKVKFLGRKRRNFKQGTEEIEKIFNMPLDEVEGYYQTRNASFKEECVPYAMEIFILSKCQYLIATPCSGTIGALAINGGMYEDVCILEDYNKASNY